MSCEFSTECENFTNYITNSSTTNCYLEDNGYDIISDVALARKLLSIVGGKRQQGGDVEHNFVPLMLSVHRVQPRGVICRNSRSNVIN